MPGVAPAEFESLPLEARCLTRGFELHDVWRVELEGPGNCTVQDLRALIAARNARTIPLSVRALFGIRSLLGRIFRLDRPPTGSDSASLVRGIPQQLATRSAVSPGTPEGPFTTLYVLPAEAAYEARNATVHALLVVALARSGSGHRFFWGTYLRPVGRITSFYMGLIDPFRRFVVYPGLETWLKQTWSGRQRQTILAP